MEQGLQKATKRRLSAAASDLESQLLQACVDGDLSTLKDLISKHGWNSIDLEVKDPSGLTPLHLACKHGHLSIIHYLIREQNCSPEATAPNGRTPLHLACKSGHLHIAKCLITEHKWNPHCTDNDGYTPLHAASESGNLAIVEYLITENDCDPEVSDSAGNTPLHYASESGHLNIVQCLITDYHCDPQKPNNRGSIPLHSACRGGALPVVKYLVSEHNCSPDHTNRDGDTPVHLACLCGHLAAVKYLTYEFRCNLQLASSNGLTPLHYACLNGHLDIVKILLFRYNCNPHAPANDGNTPLHSACQNGHLEVAKYLVYEYKCNPECGGYTPLHSAAKNDHLTVVKYLISELGCDPQCSDNNGTSPLHYACQEGHLEVAKYLITEHNCNPDYINFIGRTPLHFACWHGHLAVVKYLVCELRCDLQIIDQYGRIPLHLASQKGHMDIVTFLISKYNCDPLCSDYDGNTPLHYACANGDLQFVKYLITEHKCNPEHANTDGSTPLHSAANNGHLAVVKYLSSEIGCNPQIADNNHLTPLHYACKGGHLNIVKFLISECNCNVECTDKNGATPLHHACINEHLNIVQFLISECNCNVECTDKMGATPLHHACKEGHQEIAMLITTNPKRGSCSPHIGDKDGSTPLHYLSMVGDLHFMKYLINEHNCDPQCVGNYGQTPLHYACLGGHLDVVEYLTQQNCACDPECSLDQLVKEWIGIDTSHSLMIDSWESHFAMDLIGTEGYTPLHFACIGGYTDVAKHLINICNCNPSHGNSSGFTPFDFAQMFAHEEILELDSSIPVSVTGKIMSTLMQRVLKSVAPYSWDDTCANIDFNRTLSPLHVACIDGDLEAVKLFTNQFNSNLSSTWILDITPVHLTCFYGHLKIVMHLVTAYGCDPKCVDQCGATPLQYACTAGCLEIVEFLVTWCKFDQSDILLGLVAACTSGAMDIIEFLIPQCSAEYLFCLLFTSCVCGHLDVVKFLIDECGCDPHYTNEVDGLTPLHCTCTDMKYLLTKDYNQTLESNSSSKKCGMLSYIWQTIRSPFIFTRLPDHTELFDYFRDSAESNTGSSMEMEGRLFHLWQTISCIITQFLQLIRLKTATTDPGVSYHDISHAVHSRRKLQLKSYKFDVFRYLVVEQSCKIHCKDKDGETPLHYACASGQLDIVQYLYREHLSDLVHTTLSGDTPLHIACKSSQVEITEFLLSTGDCDPLCQNAKGITPLEITTSVEMREILDHFCKGNYPLESVVKVFVLGDPSAGKSSMVQALQSNPSFISSLIGRFQRIKGVRQQTAGIDSISFSSSDFGNVVIYDFAGQREFLTSHAAFLQNSSSHLAGLFIVVTNVAQCESDIRHSLQYWVSFILECCAHSKTKPHIIFVGSHEDQLASGDIEQRYLLVENVVTSWQDSNQFYKPKGTVYLDCTRPVSSGLDLLHYYLEESCNSIRKHAGKIDQRCYVLHQFVWNVYTGDAQGCTLENISKDLEGNSHFLPSNPTELLPLLKTLHDKGQVFLLRNNQNLGKSWVITDIAAMLETVVGSIFAPHEFPTHTSLVGSTGVVAKSRITEVFPHLNTGMIIGFLEHFEFCHRIKPDLINLSELEQSTEEMTDDEYYLFPALVTSDHPSHERQESSCCYGWLLSSSVEHQFFTARFLHVLLLRLAFLFSQPQDDTALRSAKEEPPAVKRRCKMWKNGITWHDANGVSTLFEVRDLRTVVLSMSCMEDSRIHCVRLRSQLILTILKSKDEFCPRVPTNEFVVEVADDSHLQALDERPSYSINNLSSRISTRSANDNPDLTLINPDGGKGKRISELLYFEPYALLTPDLITKLFTKETAKQSVSDDFITELAKRMYSFCDALRQVLEPSSKVLSKKCADIHGSLGEVSKQQLVCEHIVETWVEQQQRSATYGNLKRQLNRYSIFCGRNPLNLVCT